METWWRHTQAAPDLVRCGRWSAAVSCPDWNVPYVALGCYSYQPQEQDRAGQKGRGCQMTCSRTLGDHMQRLAVGGKGMYRKQKP